MEMNKQKKVLYTMILTALFTALTYVGCSIAIPFGVSKVHLGNFICILAGLLCGGFVGGFSGAVGMGLNDIVHGYGPDTFVRTFIVKFLLGYIAGALFRYLLRKNVKVKYSYYALSFVFLVVFAVFLTLRLIYGETCPIGEKSMKLPILLIVLSGVFAVLFIVVRIISNKLKPIQQYVLFVAIAASIVNVILEFLIKIPLKVLWANLTWEGAFIYSVTSLPSSLVTTIITFIFVTAIYMPLYYATKNFNKLNDVYDLIQESTTYHKKESSINEKEDKE